MMTIRRSEERGQADHGWLVARHSFSFAGYHDPAHMGFRSLRVINEDRVLGGNGFNTHPHRDMEIITYILAGALRHRDSMGHEAVMRAGDVQRISAGRGITHSEMNASPDEEVHLLQIWITPDERGVTPAYAEKSFASAPRNKLLLVTSKSGRDGSIPIHQDADLFLARLDPSARVELPLRPGRHAWIQVAEGSIELNGSDLNAGDAASLSSEAAARITARTASQVLLFDLD